MIAYVRSMKGNIQQNRLNVIQNKIKTPYTRAPSPGRNRRLSRRFIYKV